MTSEENQTLKQFRLGAHRIAPPAATLARVAPMLSRAGITRVADVTALDSLGIPVFQAIRPDSRNLCVSQGKGATVDAARASAVMEALELWHAEDLSHLPQVTMSTREMRYGNDIPVESLRWAVDLPQIDAMKLSWVRATSLSSGSPGWLPRDMLELDFSRESDVRLRAFALTSSGLASGNCREEAVLHGLCELVERHALALAFGEDGTDRRAPLFEDSIDDPWCRQAIGLIRASGAKLGLYDVTWQAGVAVMLAELVVADLPRVWRGSGCHPSAAVALSRAITEAAQSRLTYISGAREDVAPFPQPDPPWRAFAEFVEPRGARDFGAVRDCSTPSVAGDLEVVVSRLCDLGLTPYAVDLTRPELEIAVWTTFVAGLQELAHA